MKSCDQRCMKESRMKGEFGIVRVAGEFLLSGVFFSRTPPTQTLAIRDQLRCILPDGVEVLRLREKAIGEVPCVPRVQQRASISVPGIAAAENSRRNMDA